MQPGGPRIKTTMVKELEKHVTTNGIRLILSISLIYVLIQFIPLRAVAQPADFQNESRTESVNPIIKNQATDIRANSFNGPPEGNWTQFQNNSSHTGKTDAIGPTYLSEAWYGSGGGPTWYKSYPVLGENGTVYVARDTNISPESTLTDSYLCAVNPGGTVKWKVKIGARSSGAPAVGPDGTIYILCFEYKQIVNSTDYAYFPYIKAYWKTGELRWSYYTGKRGRLYWTSMDGHSFFQTPVIASDGTVYFCTQIDSWLHAFTSDGTLKWWYGEHDSELSTNAYYSCTTPPVIDPTSGTIIAAFRDGFIRYLDPANGIMLKQVNPGEIDMDYPGNGRGYDENLGDLPLAGTDGTIYNWSYYVNRKIFVMNADGTNVQAITSNMYRDFEPTWSPDGTKMALTSDRDGDWEIYTINTDGSDPVQLTNNTEGDCHPTWSPDGSKIAFASMRDGNWEIYSMNADGTGQARLTDNPATDSEPAWSPDGGKIAFTSKRDGVRALFFMESNGDNVTKLFTGAYNSDEACWSPDGSKIAFTADPNNLWPVYDYGDIGYVSVSTGGVVGLTNDVLNNIHNAAWSPDGTKIAYDSVNGIAVMNADGSNKIPLLNRRSESRLDAVNSDREPAWSPDGTKIAFSSSIGTGGCPAMLILKPGQLPSIQRAPGAGRMPHGPLSFDEGRSTFYFVSEELIDSRDHYFLNAISIADPSAVKWRIDIVSGYIEPYLLAIPIIDGEGKIYVDIDGLRIVRPDGTLLPRVGSPCLMSGIAIGSDGRLYTSDCNYSVHVFEEDITPPGNITDLRVTGVTETSVTLQWTTPGDDGMKFNWRASQYDARHSSEPINEVVWETATKITSFPTPGTPNAVASFEVTGLTTGATYYFAIKTADEVPNWSGLSNVVSATPIPPPIPTAPVPFEPANYQCTGSLTPAFRWSVPTGAKSYAFQLSAASDFQNLIVSESGLTTNTYTVFPGNLSCYKRYYWKVNATNTSGTSAWSTPWYFTTPLCSPEQVSPADNSTVTSLTPKLTWTVPQGGAAFYNLQVALDNQFNNIVINAIELGPEGYQVPTNKLIANNTYYWRVNASGACGNSSWSNTWSFRTTPSTLSPVVTADNPISVTDSSAVLRGTVVTDGGEACQYRFQYDTIAGPSYAYSTTWSTDLKTTGQSFSGSIAGLNPGTKYYFIAQAKNSAGTASGTEASFTTGTPPLEITTTSLPEAIVGTAYSQTLQVTGGIPPYTWSIMTHTLIVGQGLPPGLTLHPTTGVISGTPTQDPITWSFTAIVTDSAPTPATDTQALSINVTVPVSNLIGADDVASSINFNPNYLALTKWTATASGNLNQVRVKGGAAGNVKVALYADSAGSPGALLAANDTGQAVTSGWNTINLTSPAAVTSGTAYWLALNSDAACTGYVTGSGTMAYKQATYSGFSFPNPAGTGFTNGAYYSIAQGWGTPPPIPLATTFITPGTTLTFKWGAVDRATNYHLQVNTLSGFNGTDIFNAEVGNVTLKEVTGLTPGTTYYWHVKAGNAAGWSGWSPVRSVTTNTVP